MRGKKVNRLGVVWRYLFRVEVFFRKGNVLMKYYLVNCFFLYCNYYKVFLSKSRCKKNRKKDIRIWKENNVNIYIFIFDLFFRLFCFGV